METPKKKPTDFEVLGQMASNSMDIRSATALVNIQKVKAGGHITIGVDGATAQMLMVDSMKNEPEYITVLYVVNKKQFFDIKNKEQ